ncbi:MAG: hypothetical protein M1816_003677 [Peltula sp. TS41687]|nr:MAG: hypothetical protein M1816_003677 [Peltula sp. TS41687]
MSRHESPSKPFNIAIVGGGIGGLALAIGLRYRGIAAQVYEAAPVFTEVGAGIGFDPNSVEAMTLIDPAIRVAYNRLAIKKTRKEDADTWLTFRCGLGEPGLIARVRTANSEKTFSSVHRAHFLDALIDLLPEEVAHLGKRLVEIEDRPSNPVRLLFEDGSTAEADAVVGCDGVRSTVRQLMLGNQTILDDLTFSGKCAYRGLVPMAKAKEALGDYLAGSSSMYLGPGAHVLTYPIDLGNTVNVVAFKDKPDGVWEHDRWIVKKKKEEMRRDFYGWGKPVQAILQLMDDPDLWALFDHRPAPTYYKGRVAILGDAAHTSTPHQGAGAGQALEDAFILSTVLADEKVMSTSDVPAALHAYDAIRRPRSQKVVSTSRTAGETYAFRGPAGNDLEKVREELLTRYSWIWDEDMSRQAEDARAVLAQILRSGT